MSVGEITVGVMTVGVMRRPQKNTSQGIEKNKSTKPTVEKNYKSYLSFFGKPEEITPIFLVYFHSVRTKTSIKLTYKYHLSHLIPSTK